MTVWKYANLALLAAVYICDPWQHERVEQVRFLMVPTGGGTPYVMGDTYVPRFWPPFFTLAGSSTIFS